MLVRDTVDSDLPAITEIYRHYVLNSLASFEEVAPDVVEMTRRRQSIVDRGLPYLTAELDHRPVGFAYAAPYHTRSGYRFTVEDSVYVAPDAHRNGVGRALLERVIVIVTDLGYRRMIAVIGDSGHPASVRLHESLGFAVIGVMPAIGLKFGRWVDTMLMQRALGDGSESLPDPNDRGDGA